MLAARLKLRGSDAWGSGAYGAARGHRKHRGVDYAAEEGAYILSPCVGIVTKLGTVYKKDPHWRYVEVTDLTGLKHRIFYVTPLVHLSQAVTVLDSIGIAQNISLKYLQQDPSVFPMVNHVHYEILDGGTTINPETHHV